MSAQQNATVTRIAWVVPKLTAGGIGPVCRYAAEGVAQLPGWRCTVVALHDPVADRMDEASRVRFASLGLDADCPRRFLQWLSANPQDIVITNDVSRIEAAFPFIPPETHHVIQIHDSMRRYREVAVRNHAWVDGVSCVAHHIETPLRLSLKAAGFRGLLTTIHNGAAFPPPPVRTPPSGPLRLLFTGKMDALTKGVLDIVPILEQLRAMAVPVRLTIVGGHHELLASRLKRKRLDDLVTWTGRVPHQECYRLAAESDVFLMLSRREPFGMVTIEAMSMGCVPIAYDTPSGSTEIIEHGKSGMLVPLGGFREAVAAIRMLHENRERWADLSAGAMERARTEFSGKALAQRIVEFLKRVQVHARLAPSQRVSGLPAEKKPGPKTGPIHYQQIPAGVRAWLRNAVGSFPRLSCWLASRWNQ